MVVSYQSFWKVVRSQWVLQNSHTPLHCRVRGGRQKLEEKKVEDEVLDDFFFEVQGPTVPAKMLWATLIWIKYQ